MSLGATAPQYNVTLGPAVLEPLSRPSTSAAPLLAGLSLGVAVWVFASTLQLGRS